MVMMLRARTSGKIHYQSKHDEQQKDTYNFFHSTKILFMRKIAAYKIKYEYN